jgi:hypothetical protein
MKAGREMRARAAALALALTCTAQAPVLPQESGEAEPDGLTARLQRSVEMPAHRALLAEMEEAARVPAPFVGDGCSGGLSTAWRTVAELFPGFAEAHRGIPPWEACCDAHDALYHDAAGSHTAAESFDARLSADEALRACVIGTGAERRTELAARYGVTGAEVDTAYRAIAAAMFRAVRLGGAPCSGLPWRWGFGYPQCLPLGAE